MQLLFLLGLLGLAGCQSSRTIAQSPQQMTDSQDRVFPNAYLRLDFQKQDPVLPLVKGTIEIWLKDSHFRFKDQTKRYPSEIFADINHPQGLGNSPSTMEDIMDLQSRSDNGSGPEFVEFGGNVATEDGFVYEAGRPAPLLRKASEIVALVEQVLYEAPGADWVKKGEEMVAGERCSVYGSKIKGSLDGASFESIVTHHCKSPFILKYEVYNSQEPEHRLKWEVVEFKLGGVQESDFPHL